MKQELTQRELLDHLVASGVLTSNQADDIAVAPRWSFSLRELVSYLAALIIAAGVIRLLVLAFRDASEGVIATSLYVAAAALGVASWKLSSGSEMRRRFAEVLELGSLGAAAGATGIVLNQSDMRDEWIGVILTGAAAVWGLLRFMRSQFSGTVAFSVGTVGMSMALSGLINSDSQIVGSLLTLIAGLIVVGAGTFNIGSRVVARAIGSLFVIGGSMGVATSEDWLRPLPIATGVVLFALGAMLLAPELLVAGSFCVVAGIVMTTVEWVNNEMAQGLIIIATGLAVLGVLTVQMKRAVNQSTPGAQVA